MAGFPMPEGWKGDSADNPNFKALGKLSPPVMRKIEPSGPAYLAYARRKLKGRTFSEDDRIEALSKVKKIEDNDDGEISEPEDPMMLQRDAKDWKVSSAFRPLHEFDTDYLLGARPLRRSRPFQISLQSYRRTNQESPP